MTKLNEIINSSAMKKMEKNEKKFYSGKKGKSVKELLNNISKEDFLEIENQRKILLEEYKDQYIDDELKFEVKDGKTIISIFLIKHDGTLENIGKIELNGLFKGGLFILNLF